MITLAIIRQDTTYYFYFAIRNHLFPYFCKIFCLYFIAVDLIARTGNVRAVRGGTTEKTKSWNDDLIKLLMLMYCTCNLFPSVEFNEAGAKDIDLRVGILPVTVSTTAAVACVTGVTTTSPNEPKKRLSVEPSADEPKSKKSKSDKIDM